MLSLSDYEKTTKRNIAKRLGHSGFSVETCIMYRAQKGVTDMAEVTSEKSNCIRAHCFNRIQISITMFHLFSHRFMLNELSLLLLKGRTERVVRGGCSQIRKRRQRTILAHLLSDPKSQMRPSKNSQVQASGGSRVVCGRGGVSPGDRLRRGEHFLTEGTRARYNINM